MSATDFTDYNPSVNEEVMSIYESPPPVLIRNRNGLVYLRTVQNAIAATARPIVYSINEWGIQDPVRWNDPICEQLENRVCANCFSLSRPSLHLLDDAPKFSGSVGTSFADLHHVINQLAVDHRNGMILTSRSETRV